MIIADVGSMLILFFSLVIVLRSQNTASDLLNAKIKRISHFTVRLSGLNLIGHAFYEELEQLLKHINKVAGVEIEDDVIEIDEDRKKYRGKRRVVDDIPNTEQNIESNQENNPENAEQPENPGHKRNESEEEGSFDEMEERLKNLQKSALKRSGVIFDISFPQLSHTQIDKFDEKLVVLNERAEILKWQQHYKKLEDLEIINDYEGKASEAKSKLANVISELKAIQSENILDETVTDLIIVFKNIECAQTFANSYSSKNCCVRMWYWIFCNKKKITNNYFNDAWLNVEYSPDEPNEIIWDGLAYPGCKKFCINIMLFICGLIISFTGNY